MNEPLNHDDYLTRRCRLLNGIPIRRGNAEYVICWLQQTLRGHNNPVIDAAVALGNSLGLPVIVYHGLGQHYPHASDRLHRFILEASRSLEQDVTERGLRLLRVVERPEHNVKGLIYRLAARAAALVVDDNAAYVGRWQLETVARRIDCPVIAVDGARLIPEASLGVVCLTTPAFRSQVNDLRQIGLEEPMNIVCKEKPCVGDMIVQHDKLGAAGSADITRLIKSCDIDHSLPPVQWCSGDRKSALNQLAWAATDVIPHYAQERNNPAILGVSYLSPYLHFGVLGPHDVATFASEVDSSRGVWKFLDELLVWREFFHHLAVHTPVPNSYEVVSNWARESLALHASDAREHVYSLSELVHGLTSDETWNAAQRQFLVDGWMHNNLRMYWGKRIIGWTASPEDAWNTACYLNDRLSLDGRDPATYGNLRWCFGSGRPSTEKPVYGKVSQKSDIAMRRRPGVPEWLAIQARRPTPTIVVPVQVPLNFRPQASGRVG